MAEKYNSWSSYNYTHNNPIRYIDPDGRDVVDANGEIVNTIENKESDNFYVVDDNGNHVEGKFISFDYGTVISHCSQSGTYNKRNDDGTKSKEVTMIDIFKYEVIIM